MTPKKEKRLRDALTAALSAGIDNVDGLHQAVADKSFELADQNDQEKLRLLRQTVLVPKLLQLLGEDEELYLAEVTEAIRRTHQSSTENALWVVNVWRFCVCNATKKTSTGWWSTHCGFWKSIGFWRGVREVVIVFFEILALTGEWFIEVLKETVVLGLLCMIALTFVLSQVVPVLKDASLEAQPRAAETVHTSEDSNIRNDSVQGRHSITAPVDLNDHSRLLN